ncbi:2-dehydropantoate 2-reductase [Pedococcus dokdonensis]|uniref:2-dehydropantoate 2-reductase n=1 Tax=Pedococcus dokdonensis TaxID=443156 RepID=A0A1H0PLN0_9MICO|nr:2-dehydropantoate 2-reductase [Pedococcus dokdonensis]SDP05529.1 2-dehydropantoate 2-reductase [Pedococcus dokdonensis]
MDDRLDVAVLGAGGVGGLLAALLARSGHHVTVLARDATADHLRRHGLELRSDAYGDSVETVSAEPRLEAAPDLVLVTVKATALEDALALVPPGSLGQALVVPFLNGLDHVDLLRSRYGPSHVATGTIRVESERVSPGVVVHRSPFALVELAAGQADPAQVQVAADALAGAGLSVTVRDDDRQVLWEKLSVLAPLALLPTSFAAPWGVLRDEHWAAVESVVGEVVAAALAEGVELDEGAVLGFLRDRVPDDMRSSMQKDAASSQPLELDAIGGAVLRAARRGGTEAPVTQRLVDGLASIAIPD